MLAFGISLNFIRICLNIQFQYLDFLLKSPISFSGNASIFPECFANDLRNFAYSICGTYYVIC